MNQGTDQVRAPLATALLQATEILGLATALLRLCRDHLDRLTAADGDVRTWRARDQLHRRAVALFAEIDDEDLDPDERDALVSLARSAAELPAVLVAHVLAGALDAALGDRLLPMFLNRTTVLEPGDPIPTPHPDWRRLSPSPNSDPWALDGRLDALPHLRLAGDWARHVRVTLDGNWRTWTAVPQLGPGDRLACAVPNDSFEQLELDRDEVEGRPVFYRVRPRDPADQRRRCLALLELARQQGCRLVVFPELSVPKSALEDIAAWLDDQDVVDLVVAGSRHRRARGGLWHNLSTVLIRGSSAVLEHRKFRPFSFSDVTGDGERLRRHEHLSVTTPALRAWLSPSFTMTVLVCKDAVVAPVPQLLGDLRANLVLVPSLTFKLDAFRATAGDIATWSQGIALIANACIVPAPRRRRPPVVVAVPSQAGSVHVQTPSPCSLLIVSLGTSRRNPEIAEVHPTPVVFP